MFTKRLDRYSPIIKGLVRNTEGSSLTPVTAIQKKAPLYHNRLASVENQAPPDSTRAKWAATLGNLAALANWTIPIAAIVSLKRDPERINLQMTTVLAFYSFLFMRWSIAIHPRNYPLFFCHTTNSVAQSIQVGRSLYHKAFGKSKTEKIQDKS